MTKIKKDVSNRRDIEDVINLFYGKVRADEMIGFFFEKVVPVNWEKHLPLMYSFWENVLFYTGSYQGDVLAIHRGINDKHAMRYKHFERWVDLFRQSVDELFEGENAQKMKDRAAGIAIIMQKKIG